MQQRQLRLGDILDDYCPRERRLTNHAVVAMIGDDVKQTRCTTCETEHEYKHAKVPRQRRKGEEPAALYAQVLAGGPKRVTHEPAVAPSEEPAANVLDQAVRAGSSAPSVPDARLDQAIIVTDQPLDDAGEAKEAGDGPVHRQLIRATLPRHEGQAPPARPAPDFTIRQPGGGRPNPFRSRSPHQRGGQMFQGNRSTGASSGGAGHGGGQRQRGGRPPQDGMTSHSSRRHDTGRKRSR
jgi:hypothetical protein